MRAYPSGFPFVASSLSPSVPSTSIFRNASLLVVAFALILASSVRADDAAKSDDSKDSSSKSIAGHANQVRGDEITPECKAATERGLAWLAQRQSTDGAFTGMQGFGYSNNVAMTALAGLAFMEHGDLPGRGKYGKEVRRCLDFILDACQDSGLIASDNTQGPMYGHGFATLFLGEMYGMTGDDAVKEKLERAVKLIERTQNPEGGWRYQPAPLDADISVTICQVMALRSAREAGIHVSSDVVSKAVQYVLKCQNSDGGFSYMAGQGGFGGSGFPRSAAGCCALYYAGIFEGDNLKRGLEYVKRYTPGQGTNPRAEGHYYYGYYYATQAMFLAGGEYWATFFPAIREELIGSQNGDHWSGDFSEDYATAMALIILQMPNRYLPVFDASTGGGR
jgi:prenyltransferase beta subunit